MFPDGNGAIGRSRHFRPSKRKRLSYLGTGFKTAAMSIADITALPFVKRIDEEIARGE
jgi:hypothetical protein